MTATTSVAAFTAITSITAIATVTSVAALSSFASLAAITARTLGLVVVVVVVIGLVTVGRLLLDALATIRDLAAGVESKFRHGCRNRVRTAQRKSVFSVTSKVRRQSIRAGCQVG